ncbi:MAG TPA: DUF4388 domain-containing protein [Pyrinomonadaceae bacterium]|nr:DUF4388 domain-containing protein [Pyrinomonadaceae bacterium]
MKPERKLVNPEPYAKDPVVQRTRFMVLTGHLNDYPLADLVGILRHQQKTGRLLIEYPKGPAMFFFKDGEFVDAQFDNFNGLQAICIAVAQPTAPFNFNPLIQPSRRSIQNSLQRAVSELLGSWDGSDVEIETPALSAPAPAPALSAPRLALDAGLTAPNRQDLPALVHKSPPSRFFPTALAMAAAGLMMLGLSSLIAVTGGFGINALSAPPASPPSQPAVESKVESDAVSVALTKPDLAAEPDTERDSARPREVTAASGETRVLSNKRNESPAATQNVPKKEDPAPEVEPKRAVSTGVQSVKVVLQIENGRVLRASIANPRPGMDAYEALAIRIARQRRYPAVSAGQETVTIRINTPNQNQQ